MKLFTETSVSPNSPILVIGSHRSGSTWVGRMIAKSPKVGYIHEPLNIHHRPGICDARFYYWFPYICHDNESIYYSSLYDTLHFKYKVGAELKALKTPKDIGRFIRDYCVFSHFRRKQLIPLIKDPIAIFSAEWLAARYNMRVIVLIRHPAAFTGSLKEKGWSHPFDHFLKQPLLMRDHLRKYEADINRYAVEEQDPVDQAILLWCMIHGVILEYQKKHPDWIFVRHEDISRRPVEDFQTLFDQLNLDWSDDIESIIRHHSNSVNQHGLMRNSETNIWTWKTRLSSAEIEKVYKQTGDIWHEFYSSDDW